MNLIWIITWSWHDWLTAIAIAATVTNGVARIARLL